MKTDRELLELAAKAAGMGNGPYDFDELTGWNPLEVDGDALRLAVKLMLFDSGSFMNFRLLETRNDPTRSDYEITRRAIVRAAAAIGEQA